jgi:hypothetical protein
MIKNSTRRALCFIHAKVAIFHGCLHFSSQKMASKESTTTTKESTPAVKESYDKPSDHFFKGTVEEYMFLTHGYVMPHWFKKKKSHQTLPTVTKK